jgi:hypothetical protein
VAIPDLDVARVRRWCARQNPAYSRLRSAGTITALLNKIDAYRLVRGG